MRVRRRGPTRWVWWACPAAVVLSLGPVLAPLRSKATPAPSDSPTFIVELKAPPLAGYEGGRPGYPATSLAITGHRLDPSDPAVGRYAALGDAEEAVVLRRAGAAEAPVLYRYRAALTGFAARLTPAQVARLQRDRAVLRVTPDTRRPVAGAEVDGSAESKGSPASEPAGFLGLSHGLWARLGGAEHAGEGVVIGVIDTGVYPEHPSFADQPPAPPPAAPWHGTCPPGEAWATSACSHKLVGARFFVAGFGADNVAEGDFLSPRDAHGHGSHVAATALGNSGVRPSVEGNDLGVPATPGIAPRAQLAVYKACWVGRNDPGTEDDTGAPAPSCADSDVLAAVDAALRDGVDVLNLSLDSGLARAYGPLESSLLWVADSGVFVTASAGNRGPDPGTVQAPGGVPWVTAVGASSLARTFAATATVTGGGEPPPPPLRVTGASVAGGVAPVPLVDGAAVATAGVPAAQASFCLPGTLDATAAVGKAVVCQRGVGARREKSRVVRDAGGVAMLLANSEGNQALVAEVHSVPSVNIGPADGQALEKLLSVSSGAEISIAPAQAAPAAGDRLAGFSSRGPQKAVPDIPKPDLAAPGVAILAATTPTPSRGGPEGETFTIKSGTSMASAVVAGAAALLIQLHPTWSPAAVKSALMTTALPVWQQDGVTGASPFEAGSGRIDPSRAAEPGLVLDVGSLEYFGYVRGLQPTGSADGSTGDLQATAPSDLNLPAISYGRLLGAAATRRRFTSTDPATSSWRVSVEGLPGIAAVAAPLSFTLPSGQSQEITLGFVLAGAPLDAYTFGVVVLTNEGDGRTVRLPVSIRPGKEIPAAGGQERSPAS